MAVTAPEGCPTGEFLQNGFVWLWHPRQVGEAASTIHFHDFSKGSVNPRNFTFLFKKFFINADGMGMDLTGPVCFTLYNSLPDLFCCSLMNYFPFPFTEKSGLFQL